MNDRERLVNCMRLRPIDHLPRGEWFFRADTTEVWRAQGLPPDVPEKIPWTDCFGLDRNGFYGGGPSSDRGSIGN